MNTLQYRAYLFDSNIPRPERPVQIFATQLASIEEWARKTLTSAGPGSEVWVYEVKEVLQGSYKKTIEPSKNSTPVEHKSA
jgi:hypothetical protein